MRMILTRGIILKILVITIFYFLDVAMSSSESSSMQRVLRSDPIRPVTEGLSNEVSGELEELEARIQRLMRRYEIKGASVAVAREGLLIYARGFGYADAENGEPVEPGHMFRIASISKLITSVAVMKLQGKQTP
jgi:CubicO group peptidase (beta-lactamase class C family)